MDVVAGILSSSSSDTSNAHAMDPSVKIGTQAKSAQHLGPRYIYSNQAALDLYRRLHVGKLLIGKRCLATLHSSRCEVDLVAPECLLGIFVRMAIAFLATIRRKLRT